MKIKSMIVTFFIALVVISSYFGTSALGYEYSLKNIVNKVNKVGEYAQSTMTIFGLSTGHSYVRELKGYPSAYHKAYENIVEFHKDCESSCPYKDESYVFRYIQVRFCTDFKVYYPHRNDKFINSRTFGRSGSYLRICSDFKGLKNIWRFGSYNVPAEELPRLEELYNELVASGVRDDFVSGLVDGHILLIYDGDYGYGLVDHTLNECPKEYDGKEIHDFYLKVGFEY